MNTSRKTRKSAQRIKSVPERGYRSPILPVNFEDQKQRFFREGKPPEFVLRGSAEEIKRITSREKATVRFDHLEEAERILNIVKVSYGDGKAFLDASYGPQITKDQASKAVKEYIRSHQLDGSMTITWCSDLACSATMMWQGPALKYNRPEARRYSLWLSDSRANSFLRERGITSLLHHEIGTHFFRMHNDGLQPWFSDRKKFHLMPTSSRKLVATEEGLASINTVLDSSVKYLWTAALLYYAACKAEDLSFRELFEHLEKYISDTEQRWKHCIRVKRGLEDVNVPGGYGKDQCYFEGAMKILRNIENVDFTVLMAGKICIDEVQRCKRLARTDIIRLPQFMNNMEMYKKRLRHIAQVNGIAGYETIPKTPNYQKKSSKHSHSMKTPLKNLPKTASAPQTTSTDTPVERQTTPCRSAFENIAALYKIASQPPPFRYTHTPLPIACNPFHYPEGSDTPSPVSSPTTTSSTPAPDADRYVYSRNSSIGYASSPDVRSSTPGSEDALSTPRSQSVRPADPVPEIKQYSERTLHRKKFKTTKSTGRKRRKGGKKSTSSSPKVEKHKADAIFEEDGGGRFGCLKMAEKKK